MAIMSTFSVAHVFDEWLLYSVNKTIHDRETSVFLPRPQKEPSFKLITLVQRILARRWRWEELRWSVIVCCHDHVESFVAVRICMYVWQFYYYIRSIVRYIYDHANIGSKMGRLISLIHARARHQNGMSLLGTREGANES